MINIIQSRDVNHTIRYGALRAMRTVRYRIGPDAVAWFNATSAATNAALRLVLGCAEIVLEGTLWVVKMLRERCS